MSDNTLSVAVDQDIIPAAHHNELVEAFLQALVPRNTSRAPADLAGNLGTSIYRWDFAYIARIIIGAAAQNLKIYSGATNEIWIERGGTSNEIIKLRSGSFEFWKSGASVFSVNASGIVWSTQGDRDIPKAKVANGGYYRSSQVSDSANDEVNTPESTSFAFKASRHYLIGIQGGTISATGVGGGGNVTVEVDSNEIEGLVHDITFGDPARSLNSSAPYTHGGSDSTETVRLRVRSNGSSITVNLDDARLFIMEI